MSPVPLYSSDSKRLLIMSNISGERIMPFLWVERCLTKPDDVSLFNVEEDKSICSNGSRAAFCMKDDFPVIQNSLL